MEHETFTKTTRRAQLTQPSLNASITRLKASLGARILHRNHHDATPTTAKETLIPQAQKMLKTVKETRHAVEKVTKLRTDEVRIKTDATICTYYLPPILKQYHKTHPTIRLRLRKLTSTKVLNTMHKKSINLEIITDGTTKKH